MIQKKLILFTILFLIILYLSKEFNLYFSISIPFLIIFTLKETKYRLLKLEIHKSDIFLLGMYLLISSCFIISYELFVQSIIGKDLMYHQSISFLSIVLTSITAILEEIIYRYYFLNEFLKSKSKITSVLILSLCFSLAHIFTDTGLVYAFIFSIILSFLYIKTRSLFNVIFLHLYCNFFATYLLQYF